MTEILLGIAIVVGIINIAITLITRGNRGDNKAIDELKTQLISNKDELNNQLSSTKEELNNSINNAQTVMYQNVNNALNSNAEMQKERLSAIEKQLLVTTQSMEDKNDKMRSAVELKLTAMVDSSNKSTKEMRDSVEGKLVTILNYTNKALIDMKSQIENTLKAQNTQSTNSLLKLQNVMFASLKAINGENKTAINDVKNSVSAHLGKASESNSKDMEAIKTTLIESVTAISKVNKTSIDGIKSSLVENLIKSSESSEKSSQMIRNTLQDSIKAMTEESQRALENVRITVENNIRNMSKDNKTALDEMRNVVDEKLSATLEKRLNNSFEIINNSLMQVNKGLGDMQSLAKDVGGLKNVLQNVKVRGTWAEMQLDNLLGEMLNAEQYIKNCPINNKTQERVDFAIRLPGKGEEVLLPIDSKFPIEDYTSLINASRDGDVQAVEIAKKKLERRILDEAKSISSKYILVPKTTDFAIMYLPLEGLYAEVLSKNGLYETLQRQYRIIVCGPSTLGAMLSSLQMGFKTVAIEKKSAEIHKLLLVFKNEFSKFNELLEKTQKKIREASNTIDDATRKTRTITNKLNKVEAVEIDYQLPTLDIPKVEAVDVAMVD